MGPDEFDKKDPEIVPEKPLRESIRAAFLVLFNMKKTKDVQEEHAPESPTVETEVSSDIPLEYRQQAKDILNLSENPKGGNPDKIETPPDKPNFKKG